MASKSWERIKRRSEQDPEFYEEIKRKRREHMARLRLDPEWRKRQAAKVHAKYINNAEHRDRMKARAKKHREKDPEGHKLKKKEDYWAQIEENRAKDRSEERRARRRERYKERLAEPNQSWRVARNLRASLNQAIRLYGDGRKTKSVIKLVGCSMRHLVQHLESNFKPDMSWANYGMWHIDHIRPCVSFDLKDENQQRTCFNWTNLQPLWASENQSKNGKYNPEDEE